jgi:hypothetical protein
MFKIQKYMWLIDVIIKFVNMKSGSQMIKDSPYMAMWVRVRISLLASYDCD